MKTIIVKKIFTENIIPSFEQINAAFDSLSAEFYSVDQINWDNYSYKPEVKFRIAYSDNELFIQYRIKENGVRAVYDYDSGSKPYTDSCVEFFLIPSENDTVYYNLELNCIGHGTFACGPNRKDRTRFGNDIISRIRRQSSLGSEAFGERGGETEWSLIVAVPIEFYALHLVKGFDSYSISSIAEAKKIFSSKELSGKTFRANVYKCGDGMKVPHFVTWNPVGCDRPDFHRPEYFGMLKFE